MAIERVFPKQNNHLIDTENYFVGTIEQHQNTGGAWSTNLVRLTSRLTKEGEWKSTAEKVVLITENDGITMHQNDLILFRTHFKEIDVNNNPGEFNSKMYWLSKGIRHQGFGTKDQLKLMQHLPLSWFDAILEQTRSYSGQLLDKWVGAKDAPLIKAILLGDKSDLDIETKRVFTNTGAMHMLAVSGMHIGLIVILLGGLFKWLFLYRGRTIAMILMLLLLWFYAFLTGFSASVVRAVVMFTVIIIAQFLNRGYQPINSLALAGFFILLWDPMAIFDLGFQLSFLAMLGIFTVYPQLENSVKFKYNWLNTTWQGTAIGLASQVFTVPVSVYYFSQFPNYFILTNFGVMLFSGIMLALAIGLLAVGKWAILSLPVGWFLAVCCSLLVGYIAYIEQIPGALSVGFSPHWSWVLLMYLVVFFALYWSERGKWIHILIAFTPLIMWLQLERYNNLSKRELVIFNSNYPTLLFNTGTEKICFYSGNERGEKQAHRLVNDYSKLHPGKVEFLPLSNGKYTIHIADRKFQIQSKFGWIDLTTATEKYALITASKFVRDTFESDRKLISLQKQSSENTWYDLSDGALHLKLNN